MSPCVNVLMSQCLYFSVFQWGVDVITDNRSWVWDSGRFLKLIRMVFSPVYIQVTSFKDQEQYWTVSDQPYRYVPVQAFSDAFKEWGTAKAMRADLSVPYDRTKSHPSALVRDKYALNAKQIFMACMSREWILMKRDAFLYTFKTAQVAWLAIITSTLFFRTTLHPDSVIQANYYLGALFFALVHMMYVF